MGIVAIDKNEILGASYVKYSACLISDIGSRSVDKSAP